MSAEKTAEYAAQMYDIALSLKNLSEGGAADRQTQLDMLADLRVLHSLLCSLQRELIPDRGSFTVLHRALTVRMSELIFEAFTELTVRNKGWKGRLRGIFYALHNLPRAFLRPSDRRAVTAVEAEKYSYQYSDNKSGERESSLRDDLSGKLLFDLSDGERSISVRILGYEQPDALYSKEDSFSFDANRLLLYVEFSLGDYSEGETDAALLTDELSELYSALFSILRSEETCYRSRFIEPSLSVEAEALPEGYRVKLNFRHYDRAADLFSVWEVGSLLDRDRFSGLVESVYRAAKRFCPR